MEEERKYIAIHAKRRNISFSEQSPHHVDLFMDISVCINIEKNTVTLLHIENGNQEQQYSLSEKSKQKVLGKFNYSQLALSACFAELCMKVIMETQLNRISGKNLPERATRNKEEVVDYSVADNEEPKCWRRIYLAYLWTLQMHSMMHSMQHRG